eukprot:4298936-Amphidinium_carterae.2
MEVKPVFHPGLHWLSVTTLLQLLQEFIRRTYIQYHQTSDYGQATDEIKIVYDSFEIYIDSTTGTTN